MESGRGPVVMVIEQASSYQARQATALGAAFGVAGVPLLVHLWGSGTAPPPSLVRLVRSGRARAAVLAPLRRQESERELARLLATQPGLPRLLLGADGTGARVRADNAMGMQVIARHVVQDAGARQILVVRGLPHHPDSRERERAVLEALAAFDLPPSAVQVVTGGFDRERSFRVVRAALGRRPQIDAVVALNDRSALGALDAASALGRLVPEDLLVSGFDDEDFAEFSRPSLTTVGLDLERYGQLAAAQLLRVLAGDRPEPLAAPVRLITRGSTGCASGTGEPVTSPRSPSGVLWDRVAGLDGLLAMNRSLLAGTRVEDLARELGAGLPRLGVARGYLVLRADDAVAGEAAGEAAGEGAAGEPARGRLVLAHDLMTQESGRRLPTPDPHPFDLVRLLPDRLQPVLDAGTLVVHPLESEDGELGYLMLDPGGVDVQVGEALRVDLGRAIQNVRRASRLRERTRQLEAEVASRRTARLVLVHRAGSEPLVEPVHRAAFLAGVDAAIADLCGVAAGGAGTGAPAPQQQGWAGHRPVRADELRQALSRHELVVYYQPIVTVGGGEVVGVEALVRWQHPTRGLLLPGAFLGVAEQTGLIDPLTSYVLDRALRDCRGWWDEGVPMTVAVNLSARRLGDTGLPREVGALLHRHGLPPSALTLEITEGVMMADPARELAVLRGLRELGTDLSVDDFGTGPASLTNLTRLPVTGLKIDRSFVQPMEANPQTLTFVRSTLRLAEDLGLNVVAEGVETDSAFRVLGRYGCDRAQGFWLARPVPAGRVLQLVRDLRGRLAALGPPAAPALAPALAPAAAPPGAADRQRHPGPAVAPRSGR